MEERDLNCSEEKSYCPIMADFATKVTKIHICTTEGLKSTYCIPTDKIFTHIANFSVNLDFVPTIHLTQTVIGVGQVMTRVRNLCHYGTLYRRSLSYIDIA